MAAIGRLDAKPALEWQQVSSFIDCGLNGLMPIDGLISAKTKFAAAFEGQLHGIQSRDVVNPVAVYMKADALAPPPLVADDLAAQYFSDRNGFADQANTITPPELVGTDTDRQGGQDEEGQHEPLT